jgi:hypothetical protein
MTLPIEEVKALGHNITEGDWHADYLDNGRYFISRTDPGTMDEGHAAVGFFYTPDAEGDSADARLMAAAPQLRLTALALQAERDAAQAEARALREKVEQLEKLASNWDKEAKQNNTSINEAVMLWSCAKQVREILAPAEAAQ